MRSVIPLVASCLIVLSAPAGAKIYKCTGPDGDVSFNDKPCQQGNQEVVTTGKSSSTSSPLPSSPETGSDTKEKTPSDSIVGKFYGEDFKFSRARVVKLISYVIEIQQGGGDWLPEKEVTIFLFGSEKEGLDGKRYDIPDPTLSRQPTLILIWNAADGKRKQKKFVRDYTMQLAFGQAKDGKIDGRISLSLPNKADLSLNGTFVATLEY